jgi:hypothetical protein
MIRIDDRGVRFVPARQETPTLFKDPVTCGTCGRTWDDAHVTSVTPAPSARCPFEYWHSRPACDLIGHEGWFRLPGGNAVYGAVMFNDATARGDRPRLVRLEARADGLHQVNRYVDWDAPVEVLADYDEGLAVYDEELTD